jgi:hypothetical protein
MIQSSRHEEYSISRPRDHDDGPDGCNYKAITLTENRLIFGQGSAVWAQTAWLNF